MALLLTPRERDTERQKEQEALVKNATSLGRKVDELRELEQTSKKSLQDFQEKAFAKFQEEQEKRKGQLDALDRQIEAKQEELAEYFKPLDKQFALYVRTERGKIEAEQAKLAGFSEKLEAQAARQKVDGEKQARTQLDLEQQKLTIAARLDEIAKDGQEAAKVLSQAKIDAQAMRSTAEQEKKQADETLKKAQIVLREAELKKEEQDRREKELEDRELAVVIKELQLYSPVKQPLQTKK